MRDVIHQKEDGKWYFWDETWSFEEGPHETRPECKKALALYSINLDYDKVLGLEE